MRPTALHDFGPLEIVIAVVVASGLSAGSLFILPKANPKPEICHNFVDDDLDGKVDCADDDCYCPDLREEAVQVKPVLDLEGLTLKQGDRMPVLPDMWGAPKPAAPSQAATDKSFASTKSDPNKPIDDTKKHDMADAGTEPPADAGAMSDTDAGETQPEPSDAGTQTELDAGTGTAGDPNGVPDGDTEDPLKANAKKTYMARAQGFFRGQWNSHCTADENASASGSVILSGRTVTGVTGTGLEWAIGMSIPAPPDNYPDLYFPSIGLNLSCKKATPTP
jgi:hypothetical protein